MPGSSTLSKVLEAGIEKEKLDFFNSFLKELSMVSNIHGGSIVNNLLKEHFLSETHYREIIEHLFNSRYLPINKILDNLRKYFRKSHLCLGGSVQIQYPMFIGTVLSHEQFLRNLNDVKENSMVFNKFADVERFVTQLYSTGFVDSFHKGLVLKNHGRLVWITFDLIERNPFHYIKVMNSDHFLSSLGLADMRFQLNERLAIFIFRTSHLISRNIQIYRPTVCDSDLYEHWKPTEDEERFGETSPLSISDANNKSTIFKYGKRPEAVLLSQYLPLELLDNVYLV